MEWQMEFAQLIWDVENENWISPDLFHSFFPNTSTDAIRDWI